MGEGQRRNGGGRKGEGGEGEGRKRREWSKECEDGGRKEHINNSVIHSRYRKRERGRPTSFYCSNFFDVVSKTTINALMFYPPPPISELAKTLHIAKCSQNLCTVCER